MQGGHSSLSLQSHRYSAQAHCDFFANSVIDNCYITRNHDTVLVLDDVSSREAVEDVADPEVSVPNARTA